MKRTMNNKTAISVDQWRNWFYVRRDSAVASLHKVMQVHQTLSITGHGTQGHIGDKMARS